MKGTPTKNWWTYIVECSDGTYYTGSTTDLFARVSTHNAGDGAKYTRSRLPVTLIYSEKQESHSAALKREISIKRLTRQQKKILIKQFIHTLDLQ